MRRGGVAQRAWSLSRTIERSGTAIRQLQRTVVCCNKILVGSAETRSFLTRENPKVALGEMIAVERIAAGSVSAV
jgi:hypothetical protein